MRDVGATVGCRRSSNVFTELTVDLLDWFFSFGRFRFDVASGRVAGRDASDDFNARGDMRPACVEAEISSRRQETDAK